MARTVAVVLSLLAMLVAANCVEMRLRGKMVNLPQMSAEEAAAVKEAEAAASQAEVTMNSSDESKADSIAAAEEEKFRAEHGIDNDAGKAEESVTKTPDENEASMSVKRAEDEAKIKEAALDHAKLEAKQEEKASEQAEEVEAKQEELKATEKEEEAKEKEAEAKEAEAKAKATEEEAKEEEEKKSEEEKLEDVKEEEKKDEEKKEEETKEKEEEKEKKIEEEKTEQELKAEDSLDNLASNDANPPKEVLEAATDEAAASGKADAGAEAELYPGSDVTGGEVVQHKAVAKPLNNVGQGEIIEGVSAEGNVNNVPKGVAPGAKMDDHVQALIPKTTAKVGETIEVIKLRREMLVEEAQVLRESLRHLEGVPMTTLGEALSDAVSMAMDEELPARESETPVDPAQAGDTPIPTDAKEHLLELENHQAQMASAERVAAHHVVKADEAGVARTVVEVLDANGKKTKMMITINPVVKDGKMTHSISVQPIAVDTTHSSVDEPADTNDQGTSVTVSGETNSELKVTSEEGKTTTEAVPANQSAIFADEPDAAVPVPAEEDDSETTAADVADGELSKAETALLQEGFFEGVLEDSSPKAEKKKEEAKVVAENAGKKAEEKEAKANADEKPAETDKPAEAEVPASEQTGSPAEEELARVRDELARFKRRSLVVVKELRNAQENLKMELKAMKLKAAFKDEQAAMLQNMERAFVDKSVEDPARAAKIALAHVEAAGLETASISTAVESKITPKKAEAGAPASQAQALEQFKEAGDKGGLLTGAAAEVAAEQAEAKPDATPAKDVTAAENGEVEQDLTAATQASGGAAAVEKAAEAEEAAEEQVAASTEAK